MYIHQIEEVVFEKEENHLLLTLEAQGFAGLVKMSVSRLEQASILPSLTVAILLYPLPTEAGLCSASGG
jgi:hypothetical protein